MSILEKCKKTLLFLAFCIQKVAHCEIFWFWTTTTTIVKDSVILYVARSSLKESCLFGAASWNSPQTRPQIFIVLGPRLTFARTFTFKRMAEPASAAVCCEFCTINGPIKVIEFCMAKKLLLFFLNFASFSNF